MPLHPYTESPCRYDSVRPKSKCYIIKYYYAKGICKATDEMSKKTDLFITESLKSDSADFIEYSEYYIDIYRESKNINDNYRQQIDGIFSNLLSEHDEDLLFRYEWSGKKFKRCQYYKNGKVFKTVYGKGDGLFKQSFLPPKESSRKIEIKEVQ